MNPPSQMAVTIQSRSWSRIYTRRPLESGSSGNGVTTRAPSFSSSSAKSWAFFCRSFMTEAIAAQRLPSIAAAAQEQHGHLAGGLSLFRGHAKAVPDQKP
jgi:hypothetical protein